MQSYFNDERIASPLLLKYEEIIEIVNSWKEECRMIMCALNAKNVKELQNIKYVLYGKTKEFYLKINK